MTGRGKLKAPQASGGGQRIVPPSGGGNSTQTERVVLSMEHFMCACVHDCQMDHVQLFADKLRRLTSATWQQVVNAPREGLGFEKIPRAQFKKQEVVNTLPEDTVFLLFRCSDAIRMMGFRRGAVLHVRAVAPDKKLY